jgi:hypothetical protein
VGYNILLNRTPKNSQADNLGSPDKLSNVGIEGPKTSASRIPALNPLRANAKARLTATVDFPTPPFAEDTAITLLTSWIFFF